jgi:hypothetical protein
LGAALGTLLPAQIILIIAVVWYLAKLDSRVNDVKNMAVRCHKRVDRIEEDLLK